jgi:hypothetical protein
MRIGLLTIAAALALHAGDGNPVVRSWLINPAAQSTSNPALRAILPNVQSVRVDEAHVYVESAGLSLQSLGGLEANDRELPSGPRKFVFRFPLKARPAEGHFTSAPLGVVGAFLNGVPIYNPISAASYRDQNLWHLDAIAAFSQQARAQSPLLTSLFDASSRHSPLIGFALDGFPIYGPYGWNAEGRVQRLRSSYRLRAITRRTRLPDGTELSPSQEGPPVGAGYPLGTFVEDYEYVAGAGDLDEHNGRSTKTPEYPDGTYAYFLSTYPYLIGPSYFGYVDRGEPDRTLPHYAPLDPSHAGQIDLTTAAVTEAGHTSTLTLTIRDDQGRKIRFLEKAHERPIHLLVVSTDLAEFTHIHPDLQPDDSYTVTYSFPHGGTYWLFADYIRPGAAQSISRFRLSVKGEGRPAEALRPDTNFTKIQEGLQVKLTVPARLRAGQDLPLRFDVSANDLEPYLGAWAHIMIVSGDRQEFIHAHPLEGSAVVNTGQHTHAALGPSPSTISTIAGFRKPGIYRIWVQFQRQEKVITIPYTIQVDPVEKAHHVAVVPAGAIRVRVSSSGFEPARIAVASGQSAVLAFERKDAQNCASSVVFPELTIRKSLPVGEITLIDLPASVPRELSFVCGMGMYRGALVIR